MGGLNRCSGVRTFECVPSALKSRTGYTTNFNQNFLLKVDFMELRQGG
jgi:hypothetical protein